jgi:hypothetical protein
MLIFSVSFQFFRMHPRREQLTIDLDRALRQNFEFFLDDGCGRNTGPDLRLQILGRRPKRAMVRPLLLVIFTE